MSVGGGRKITERRDVPTQRPVLRAADRQAAFGIYLPAALQSRAGCRGNEPGVAGLPRGTRPGSQPVVKRRTAFRIAKPVAPFSRGGVFVEEKRRHKTVVRITVVPRVGFHLHVQKKILGPAD